MEVKDRPQEIIPSHFGPQWEAEIRIKAEQVDRLTEIPYLSGFEEYAAYSPFLEENTPVVMRFSWGKNAPNMSGKHIDESKGESSEDNLLNASIFLDSQPFKTDSKVVHVIGNFQGTQYQIQEVSSLDFKSDHDDPTNLIVDENDPDFAGKRDLDIQANFVFTRDPNVVLTIKPADCPIVVGYCQDRDGNDITFIDHMGADAKNAGISRQGLLYLRDELGVDLSTVKVAILPGVSKKHYDISNEPERRGNGIVESNWQEFIDPKYPDYIVEMLLMKDPDYPKMSKKQKDEKREGILNGQKRHVDIMEATIVELLGAGVLPGNMQAIQVDSYEAAEKDEAFSHRFTMEHDGARKGRSFVAVQLRKTGDNIPERAGRFDRSILPDSAELARILEKESKRRVPEENQDIHFPQFDTVVKIFEHYGVSPEVFTDPSLKIDEVLTEGKKILDELVQKILANPIDKDEIALFDAAYSYLSEEDIPQTSDMIFVFGAKTPLRAEKALELYRSKLAGKVMVSGGSPFYQPDEEAGADRYKGILVSGGVPQEDIISENRSITMPDNVRSSLNLLDTLGTKPESMILVNSPYAQRRGWSLMRKYLSKSVVLQRVNAGVDLELSKDEWYKTENSLRVVLNEFIKMRSLVASNKA